MAAQLLEADYMVLAEPVGDGECLRVRVTRPAAKESEQPSVQEALTAIDQSMAGQALTTGCAVTSPNLAEDRRFLCDPLRNYAVGSVLMLPLVSANDVLCVTGVVRVKPGSFLLDEVISFSQIMQALISMIELAADLTPISQRRATTENTPIATQGQRAESRASQRHEYHYTQWIAPIRSWHKPAPGEFVEAQCSDLSAGGFSLWLDYQPDFRELVVALGKPPSVAHIHARVVHVREVRQGGRRFYQLGCQFLERVFL